MRIVLLVADLEGVAGVDELGALVAGSGAHGAACELLTAEVLAAIEGFRDAGFQRIRVSDSHGSGAEAANVLAARLPPDVELVRRDDAYAPAVFSGVAAVACLGMHAAAGSAGFAAHTVNVCCGWSVAGKNINESDMVLGLAAAQGLPAVFVSGDDVLERELCGRVPCVVTKRAVSQAAARSLSPEEARARLRAAAAAPPVPAPALPDGPWRLRFKSRWQPALLVRSGARRVSDLEVEVDGAGTRERYARAFALARAVEEPVVRAVRGFDPEALREDAVAALRRGFERAPPPSRGDAARRALAAFLRLTLGDAEWQLADRALALHMLEGHAPAFFAAANLAPVLEAAVSRLSELSTELPEGLDPSSAMWRLDGAYVRAERGLAFARLEALPAYARSIARESPPHAWLLWEMGTQIGLCPRFVFPVRPLRPHARIEDLYWLTHLFLLATRFLRAPFDPAGWEAEIEELFLATPTVFATDRLDLGAEIAICLQLAGEDDSRELRDLLDLLERRQREDGTIVDAGSGPDESDRDAHATGAALLALARHM